MTSEQNTFFTANPSLFIFSIMPSGFDNSGLSITTIYLLDDQKIVHPYITNAKVSYYVGVTYQNLEYTYEQTAIAVDLTWLASKTENLIMWSPAISLSNGPIKNRDNFIEELFKRAINEWWQNNVSLERKTFADMSQSDDKYILSLSHQGSESKEFDISSETEWDEMWQWLKQFVDNDGTTITSILSTLIYKPSDNNTNYQKGTFAKFNLAIIYIYVMR